MPSKTNTCIDCGGPTNGIRCKSCSIRKRWEDRRAAMPLPNPSGLCWCGCGGITPLADATRLKFGLVRGEHTRWILGHQSRKEPRVNSGNAPYLLEDRGYKTPCWIWQGGKRQGYASRRKGHTTEGVHRVMYEERYGSVPEGMVLDHLCQQRDCINIDHLEVVSIGENVRRGTHPKMVAFREGTCVQGHPRTPENSYISASGRQICRICRNEYKRRHGKTTSTSSVPEIGTRPSLVETQ